MQACRNNEKLLFYALVNYLINIIIIYDVIKLIYVIYIHTSL